MKTDDIYEDLGSPETRKIFMYYEDEEQFLVLGVLDQSPQLDTIFPGESDFAYHMVIQADAMPQLVMALLRDRLGHDRLAFHSLRELCEEEKIPYEAVYQLGGHPEVVARTE